MKKIILSIFTIILTFSLLSLLSAGAQNLELVINGEAVAFSNAPITSGSAVMLPLDETLRYFGALPKWREEGKNLSCLYNNMFCNLTLGSPKVFINGIGEDYEPGPSLVDGVAYAPLDFFLNYLALNSNQTENTVELTNRNTTLSTLFGFTAFQDKILANTDVRLALPQNWQQLTENSIGVSNPYETYSFELNIVPNYTRISTNAYIAELISKAQKALETKKYKMDNMESSTLSTDDHVFDVFYYSTTKAEEKDENNVKADKAREEGQNQAEKIKKDGQNQVDKIEEREKPKEKPVYHSHYILLHEGSLYDFHFRHNKFTAKNKVLKDFENALLTLRLSKTDLNSYFEHYYETQAFYDYGLKLNSNIYSNMEIKDHILLEGSINHPDIRELKVTVTKDGEIYEYPIEIKANREFSSLVYSPFGVGKHNFVLYINTAAGREELLKFSALNISGTNIAYTIPSEKVISNSAQTRDLLTMILSEAGKNRAYSSDYSVASTVFDYVKKLVLEAGIDENSDRDLPYNEIPLQEKMSEREAAILYCSLIRAAGIPCRIMQGENKDLTRVFTSCYINGNWFVYDIASEYYRSGDTVSSGNREEAIPELHFPSTKHLTLDKYNEVFDKMTELSY